VAALNSTNTSGADNIITIKQESITSVDNLVGGYVDSTTFLPSPNSQIINANLVQSIAMANDANDGKITRFSQSLKSDYNKWSIIAGTAQQQTELVFTEDDSSCDSHKWGKNSIPQTKSTVIRNRHRHNHFGELLIYRMFCLFFRNFFLI
jgi:hypothetical protein